MAETFVFVVGLLHTERPMLGCPINDSLETMWKEVVVA
jgi:hypothetical protein